MKSKNFKIYSAAMRALRTMIEIEFAALFTSIFIESVSLTAALSIAIVAGVTSIIVSMFSLPEIHTDGTLLIDTRNDTKDIYRLELRDDCESLSDKSIIRFDVDVSANLSHK